MKNDFLCLTGHSMGGWGWYEKEKLKNKVNSE